MLLRNTSQCLVTNMYDHTRLLHKCCRQRWCHHCCHSFSITSPPPKIGVGMQITSPSPCTIFMIIYYHHLLFYFPYHHCQPNFYCWGRSTLTSSCAPISLILHPQWCSNFWYCYVFLWIYIFCMLTHQNLNKYVPNSIS